jgi:hypothetical protein
MCAAFLILEFIKSKPEMGDASGLKKKKKQAGNPLSICIINHNNTCYTDLKQQSLYESIITYI